MQRMQFHCSAASVVSVHIILEQLFERQSAVMSCGARNQVAGAQAYLNPLSVSLRAVTLPLPDTPATGKACSHL